MLGVDIADALACPNCGSGCDLHQGKVTVFDCGQDEEIVTRTEISNGMVSSHRISGVSGNPSPRRQGLTIEFS